MKVPSFDSVEKAAEFLACAQVVGRATSTQYKYAEGEGGLQAVLDWAKKYPEYAGPLIGALAGGGFGALTSLNKDEDERNMLGSAITGGLSGGLLGLGAGYGWKNRKALGFGGDEPSPSASLDNAITSMMDSGRMAIGPDAVSSESVVAYPDKGTAAKRIEEVMGMTGPEALKAYSENRLHPQEYALTVQGSRGAPIKSTFDEEGGLLSGLTDFATAEYEDELPTNLPQWPGMNQEDRAIVEQAGRDFRRQQFEDSKPSDTLGWIFGGAPAVAAVEGGTILAGDRRLGDLTAGMEGMRDRAQAAATRAKANLPAGATSDNLKRQTFLSQALDTALTAGNEKQLRGLLEHLQATDPGGFSKFYQNFKSKLNAYGGGRVGIRPATPQPATYAPLPGSTPLPGTDAIDDIFTMMGDPRFERSVYKPHLESALREALQKGQAYSGSFFRPWWHRLAKGDMGVGREMASQAAQAAGGKLPWYKGWGPNMGQHLRGAGSGLARGGAYIGLPLLMNWGLDQAHKIRWRNKPVELPKPVWKPDPVSPLGG